MLTKELLKGAKAICANVQKDETRRSLHRMRIDESGWAVATDGHCLLAERTNDPEGWIDPVQLTVTKDAVVERNGAGCYVEQKGKRTHHPDREDYFPNWAGVMPGGFQTPEVDGYRLVGMFDPALLIRLLQGFDPGTEPAVELWMEDHHEGATLRAVLVRQNDRYGLAMPCRMPK